MLQQGTLKHAENLRVGFLCLYLSTSSHTQLAWYHLAYIISPLTMRSAVFLFGVVYRHSLALIVVLHSTVTNTACWQSPCLCSQGRTYTIESNIDSTARKEAVLDVLTDYSSHPDVFSSIHSSRVVTRDENEAHVLQVRKP